MCDCSLEDRKVYGVSLHGTRHQKIRDQVGGAVMLAELSWDVLVPSGTSGCARFVHQPPARWHYWERVLCPGVDCT